jgi:F-box domain
MPPITFDSLPNEIVLNIIIRVPFSSHDFVALRLTNRRINTLTCQRGHKLLEDIAKAQFPYALWAATTPQIPFDKDATTFTFDQLRHLSYEASSTTVTIDGAEALRQFMVKEGALLGPALGAKGWKTNLRIALHLLTFPSIPSKPRRDGVGIRTSRHYAKVIDHLPLYSILALRHSAFMAFEALEVVDKSFSATRIDLDQPAVPCNIYADAVVRRAIESSPYATMPYCFHNKRFLENFNVGELDSEETDWTMFRAHI